MLVNTNKKIRVMNIKYLLIGLIILLGNNLQAQDYNYKVIEPELSRDVIVDNCMNWLIGYSRTSKIKKLKAESSSGESSTGDEDYITWNSENHTNILTSNKVRFKAYVIKYNVQIKIRNNKALIVVKNVFWRNIGLSEKVPYTPISLAQSEEYTLAVMTPGNYDKMIIFFNDYIQDEIFNSIKDYLTVNPIKYEKW
jgi:hypothetical protein